MTEDPTVVKITPGQPKLGKGNAEPELGNDSWQMLQIFSIYRCLLTSAFFILFAMNAGTVGKDQPLIYLYGLLIYLLLSVVYVVNAFLKNQNYSSQVNLQILTDIAALTLILHTSGGLSSGLNILFLPVIAAASALMPGKKSLFYAAIATISILIEQLITYIIDTPTYTDSFTLAGFTGVAIFATAIAINIIYKKLKISENIGKQYEATIEKFEQIIRLILHKMPIGVLVVDKKNRIYITNEVGQKFLQIENMLPKDLFDRLQIWRSTEPNYYTAEYLTINGIHTAAQFIPVGENADSSIIIMLEDLTQQEQQAQNLKLMSLGRLTASIAHEIRNPLNAISHSTQLLSEAKNLPVEDLRLLEIIHHNTERTNKIIESVLLLSKSKPVVQETIRLNPWLHKFTTQFIMQDNTEAKIDIQCDIDSANIKFDPTHLQQILTNLCENGIRYSLLATKESSLQLHVGIINQQVYLDVLDNGPGVTKNNQEFLFEPFFTTENTGTGLGLFVARELARANGAKLEYNPMANKGSCFRIYFPRENNK